MAPRSSAERIAVVATISCAVCPLVRRGRISFFLYKLRKRVFYAIYCGPFAGLRARHPSRSVPHSRIDYHCRVVRHAATVSATAWK